MEVGLFSFIILALATYGASALVVRYDGPYGLFARIRHKFPNSPFVCTVCLSVWVAILFVPFLFSGLATIPYTFAAVGAIILIEEVV